MGPTKKIPLAGDYRGGAYEDKEVPLQPLAGM